MKKVVSVSIDEDVYSKIRKLREEKKINVSAFINEKLKEILEREFNL